MLEIAILFVLCGKIGKIVESKGRKKTGYQFMLVGLWFGGEIFGAIVGATVGMVSADNEDGVKLMAVGMAYICSIIAAIIAFQIVKHLQPLEPEDGFYPDIEYADRLQASERFGDRNAVPPLASDAYTENPEKGHRPLDDRIQE